MFKICSDVLRYVQMFSDDHRCFWIFTRYSRDVLLIFSRCSQNVALMKDPKELDDPQLFDDPSYLMIPSYLMVNWKYGL